MNVLKHMHKWYSDGLINPDAATTDQGPQWCVISSGQGFPGAEVSWASGRGADVYAEPFIGPLYSTTSILGSVNAISAASKYKSEALKYLEFVNTDETMRNLLAYGIEGQDYTMNEDGTITRAENCYSPATYAQASYFTLYPVAPNAADQWDKVEEWNETAESSVLLGFNFDRTNVETQIANCSLVMDRYKKELYTGTRDPEEAVPALYADLEKAGLEDIRAEYQAQVDIAQNRIMKLLTIVTTIFMPLSLIVGWYGMNFAYMPELGWRYGYPAVIAVSVLVVGGCVVYFRRKRYW